MADRSNTDTDTRSRDRQPLAGMMTDAVRRETQNELDRLARTKADGLKDYEKREQARAQLTARLRAQRLAREAAAQRAKSGTPAKRRAD